jgi:exoribonuclease II
MNTYTTDGKKISNSEALEILSNGCAHHLARSKACGVGEFCIHRSTVAKNMEDMNLILAHYNGSDRAAWIEILHGYGEMYDRTVKPAKPHLRLVK